MELRDEAQILRRVPYRETSLVMWLLTRRQGVITVMARGARRPGRTERALLAGFHTVEVVGRGRAAGGMATLTGVALVRGRYGLPGRPAALEAAQVLQEAVYRFCGVGDPQPVVFGLLEQALDRLDGGDDSLAVAAVAQWEVLAAFGFGGRGGVCLGCGRSGDPAYYSRRGNGLVCRACGLPHAHRLEALPAGVAVWMRAAIEGEWPMDPGASGEDLAQLYCLGNRMLVAIGGRPLVADRSFRVVLGWEPVLGSQVAG